MFLHYFRYQLIVGGSGGERKELIFFPVKISCLDELQPGDGVNTTMYLVWVASGSRELGTVILPRSCPRYLPLLVTSDGKDINQLLTIYIYI